jgi:glycine/D-amino acid oxidase-like deaminating enzyme
MITDGESKSIWYDTGQPPQEPTLAGDTQADVAIVGGGIAGLTVAYMLAREGKRVVVLEDKKSRAGRRVARPLNSRPPATTATRRWKNFTARAARESSPRVSARR